MFWCKHYFNKNQHPRLQEIVHRKQLNCACADPDFFSGEEGSGDYLSLQAMEWGTKGIFSIILLCSKKFRSAHACWTRHSFIINSFMWCRNRGVSIKQMHTFKIRFKMKCTSDDGMIRSLAISWIMYVPSRLVISLSTRHLPGMLRSHVAQILLDLWRTLCQWKSLSPPTNCLIPNDCGCCFFLNPFLNPFPNHFYRGQRLALRLKLCRSNVLCLYRLKDIVANQN